MWTHFNIQDEKMILCVHIRQKENLEMQQLLLNSLVLLIRTIAIVQRILLSRITEGKLEVNKLLRKSKSHKELRNCWYSKTYLIINKKISVNKYMLVYIKHV